MFKISILFMSSLLLVSSCHQKADEHIQKQEEPTDLIHDDLKYRETRDLPAADEVYTDEDTDKSDQ